MIPWLGRYSGGGHNNPLQYSCLGNSMYRGAWWTTVHGAAKRQLSIHSICFSDFAIFDAVDYHSLLNHSSSIGHLCCFHFCLCRWCCNKYPCMYTFLFLWDPTNKSWVYWPKKIYFFILTCLVNCFPKICNNLHFY